MPAKHIGVQEIVEVKLERGLGKDGNPAFSSYVRQYPTNYRWVARVKRRAHEVVNMRRFRGKLWICTYEQHPPAFPQPMLSLDFWGFGGRGDPVDFELGHEVYAEFMRDPAPPDIWWSIWNWEMFVRSATTLETWIEPAPDGPPDSDAQHTKHGHITFAGAALQRAIRSRPSAPMPTSLDEVERDARTEFGHMLSQATLLG